MKKNVLIVSCVFPPEPVVSASLSFDLANELARGHIVSVITPDPTRPHGYDFSENETPKYAFKHTILKSFTYPKSKLLGRMLESYSFGKACSRYIKSNAKNIDMIYLNTWPLAGQYYVIMAAKKCKIPTVVHIQDIYPETIAQNLRYFRSIIVKLLLPMDIYITHHCTNLITISHGMKDYLISSRNISATKAQVVHNWQDHQKFILKDDTDVSLEKNNMRIVFMFLGSLSKSANIDNLLHGFKLSKIDSSELVIAGEGSEKDFLTRICAELSLTNVNFRSAPQEEAGAIQASSDILLLSLKSGGAKLALPSKLSAYMFSARPILAVVDHDSDVASAIRDSGCGWIVDPENPAALCKRMRKISLESKENLRRMGLLGREYALKNYSRESNLTKLVSIIESSYSS